MLSSVAPGKPGCEEKLEKAFNVRAFEVGFQVFLEPLARRTCLGRTLKYPKFRIARLKFRKKWVGRRVSLRRLPVSRRFSASDRGKNAGGHSAAGQ